MEHRESMLKVEVNKQIDKEEFMLELEANNVNKSRGSSVSNIHVHCLLSKVESVTQTNQEISDS